MELCLRAMKLLESTDLLKIEDLLPFFPDFVVVDDFKDEICAALEGYSAHIETLREEMEQATKSAASITAEIENLRNRFITIDASDRCSHCNLLLMTRQFYVFPCQHVFHADCLITLVCCSVFGTLADRLTDQLLLLRLRTFSPNLLCAESSTFRPSCSGPRGRRCGRTVRLGAGDFCRRAVRTAKGRSARRVPPAYHRATRQRCSWA